MSGLSKDMIIHPGETLKEIMEDRNISPLALALKTGIPIEQLTAVLNCGAGISVPMARQLAYGLGTDAEFWINLQDLYDNELKQLATSGGIK